MAQDTFPQANPGPAGTGQPQQQVQPRLVAVKASISEIAGGNYFEVSGRWEPDYLISPSGRRMSRVNLLGVVVANYFAEDGNYGTVTIDDGTETIRLKAFKGEVKILKELQFGQVVSVIGKLRKYRDEVYISPEAIFPSDLDKLMLRRLELVRETRKVSSLRDLVAKTSAEFDDPSKMVEFLSTKYGFDRSAIEAVIVSQNPSAGPGSPAAREQQAAAAEEGAEGGAPEAPPSAAAIKAKQAVLSAIEKTGSSGAEYGAILRETGLSSSAVDESIKELISEGEIFEPKSGRFRRLL